MVFSATKKFSSRVNSRGIGLVESIVGIAVFLIIAVSVYQTYAKIFDFVRLSRVKLAAAALANEQFEIVRNLPFSDVGIVGGIPVGKIPRVQSIVRSGTTFNVTTTIRNIDDSFDGTIDGIPKDLSPTDYKIVEIEISCGLCKNFLPTRFTTLAAPKSLEGESTSGALFIKVFDANGQPVQGANVHIENQMVIPFIIIDDVTNNEGLLSIVGVPPGAEAYDLTVSKSGYSVDKTYKRDESNPNPVKPPATIAKQQATQISFSIDKTSAFDISSVTETCLPVSDVSFSLTGSRLIGANPDVIKYQSNQTTGSNGAKTIGGLEWDVYNFSPTDDDYNLWGISPSFPLTLSPNSIERVQMVMSPKTPKSFLVSVKDGVSGLPLSGATVILESDYYQNSHITGQGFLRQTDWSGGDGQADFLEEAKYYQSDGNIEVAEPAGEMRLKGDGGSYFSSGSLVSSAFDTGSPSNFHQISWQPEDQPLQVGTSSVKFQIAANNDQTTWDFIGPDGTALSFYTLFDSNINQIHNGSRYLRYKIFLETASTTFAPNVSDVAFTFTSSCVPPGQVIFDSLDLGNYLLTVSKSGYQTFNGTVSISSDFNQEAVSLLSD